MIGRNEWEDPQVTVAVTIDVTQAMHERDGADAVAENLVRQALGPTMDPTNWHGRFAIVREIRAI
jgi:hypothetical protein